MADPSLDYYELLAVPATASESEIRRAYRKTSRLYHPDKVTPTPETLEKFQLLQNAIHILTDVAEKAKYDQTREAKQRRAAETAALDDRRRRMKEDLERREAGVPFKVDGTNGVKRTWSDRELAIKRIAEENRKRREDAMAKRVEEAKAAEAQAEAVRAEPEANEMERCVKVQWIKEGDGLDIDETALMDMFPAGDVDTVVLMKDKKRRTDGREKKVLLGTAALVFKTISAAKRAVLKGRTEELESITWSVEKTTEPP